MAITTVNVASPSNEKIYQDTSATNAVNAIKASSTLIYYIIVDNSLNIASSYFKAFNLASGSVTLGTTAPDFVALIPGSSIITIPFFTSAANGITFGTALSYAVVTTGGTSGTSAPASAVTLTVSYV